MPLPDWPHVYRWIATYSDGTTLVEWDGETQHGFAHIDQGRLVELALEPLVDGLPALTQRIDAGAGERVIFFRRYGLEVNPTPGHSGQRLRTVLGWQRTVRGRNVRHYTVVRPDGTVVQTTRDDGSW